MKILLLSISLLFFNSSTNASDVYICVSKTATKYHLNENCKGLSSCAHVVKKVSLKEAKQMGYSILCGWED
ncbi:hypothetical protein FNW52_12590 [Flavobacterium sp. ZT3R18]|uniref:hypothetical protein n=1 Tax=Flavobacterium sp. ZT3R18 TaxID=2594429 RepID=UPI00117B45D9|nr:hypothetical protein [Flavobacterium sp. ZT3R18]TRX34973.1 hypothetical protein FNW52_12590 [Flavobacterium sp. ZT3R18]